MKNGKHHIVQASIVLTFYCFTILSAARLNATGKTMSATFGPPAEINTWQKYVISLNKEVFKMNETDFQQILTNVKSFRIRTEMSDAKDIGGIDSVRVGNSYTSEFTTGTDGWSSAGDGTMEWRPGAGKPGGYLQISDWGTGDWHWAVAPADWVGNWTELIGSSISFYYKTDHPDYAAIIEISAEENIHLNLTAEPLLVPLGGTTRMRVGLNEVAATDLVVTINSSNPNCLTTPESVIIRKGEQDVAFTVRTNNSSSTGCNSVITASAQDYGQTRMTLYVGKSSDVYKNGVLEGHVTDALSGDGIEDAIVSIAGSSDTTDINGHYRIENIPTSIINANFTAEPHAGKAPLTVRFYDLSSIGSYSASALSEGYYRSETFVSFYEGEIKYLDFSLSPVIGPGEYRLVLNWGTSPKDLDLHVRTPLIDGSVYEIYWDVKGSRNAVPFIALDIDRQEGFGPETITISKRYPGTYQCFVDNYSTTPSITTSYATVQIYGTEGLLKTVNVPTTGSGRYWYVCDIDGNTGSINIRNTISDGAIAGRMSSSLNKIAKPGETSVAQGGVVSWEWDFESDGIGDSYIQNPEHTYNKPGYYTVTLKVSDGVQDFVMTKDNYISVQPAVVTDVAWYHQDSHITNDLYAVCAVDTLNAWAAGSGGAIVHTLNGGEHWEAQFTFPQFTIYDLHFINANIGWAVGTDTKQNAVILKSNDGGAHWTRWPSSTSEKLFSNHMLSATLGFNSGQSGKIEKTVDGGANWSAQYTGVSSTLRAIFFLNTDLGWVVGENGIVLKTIDGGGNWILQTSGVSSQINDVFFIDDRFGWAVTVDGKVLTTTNGGTTWAQKQLSESALDAVYFENAYYGYVVGAYGRIYKTVNAGDSWILDPSSTSQHLQALYIVSNTCAWTVGNNGTILRLQRGIPFPTFVSDLHAEATGPNSIILHWTNPSDINYAGTVVQRKIGSYPEDANDGSRIYNGTGNSCNDTGLNAKTTYYYAAFAYNNSGYYSTLGATSRIFTTTYEGIALYGIDVTISSIDAAAFPIVKSFVSVVDSATLNPVTGLTAVNFKVKENGYSESPISVEAVNISSNAKADIVFVFDTTGSMGEEIDGLKQRASNFADVLAAKGIDYRLALVTFGDEVEQVHDFTTDITIFKGWIESLYASGGGDIKENALEGLARATKMDFRAVSQRIAILITDAPYHQIGETGGEGTTIYSTETMIALLKEYQIMTNVVGPDELQFHQIADGTGGLFFDISGDFQAVIDRISSVLSSQYVVSYTTHNAARDNTWRNVIISAEKGIKGGYDTGRYFVSSEIQNVTGFSATAVAYDKIQCRWLNPASGPIAGVKVVRKLSGYPKSLIDGILVYEGIGTSFIDKGLSPETIYSYGVFTYNSSGQVSSVSESAQGSARTWPFWNINTSWIKQPGGFTNNLYAVYATDTTHAWVAGSDGAHARTSNGGASWEQRFIATNLDVFDLDFINGSTGWLVGQENKNKGLNMKTGSAGLSWTPWPSSSDKMLYANCMVSDLIGWNVGGLGHIEKTTDGGAHWIQQYRSDDKVFRDVAFVTSNTGWVVGDNGVILKTADGGVNWTSQGSGVATNINGVWFTDEQAGWAVTSDGKVLHTVNGGISWSVQNLTETSLHDIHFPDIINGCIVGALGRIYRTRDGGDHWALEETSTLFTLNAVHLITPSCGWAVGDGGTILKLGRSGSALNGLTLTVNSINTESFPQIKSFVTVVDAASRTTVSGLNASHFKVREDEVLQTPITVESLTGSSGVEADIVFVFDITNSMSDEIVGLKNRALSFADVFAAKGISCRLALVTFSDIVEQVHDFTNDVVEFKTWMEAVSVLGGGDVKENALEGLAKAAMLSFRPASQKMIILITDTEYLQAGEPGDGSTSYTTDTMISLLRYNRIIAHVVGPDLPQFHSLAEKTSGLWFNIGSDFRNIIDNIGSMLSSQYVITYTSSRPEADNSVRQVAVVAEKETKGGYDISNYYVGSSRLVINPQNIIGIKDGFFDISVDVENILNLGLCHFILTYNKTKVLITNYSSGEFLSQGGASTPALIATDDTTNGKFDVTLTRVGSTLGASGSGTLLNVRFKVRVDDCNSDLNLISADLRTLANTAIAITTRSSHIQAATTAGIVGDFDKDMDIDLRDFTLLSSYWQPVNDLKGDIGPARGALPALVPIADGKVNFEDLFVFTRMWNWHQSRGTASAALGKGVACLRWQIAPNDEQGNVYQCNLIADRLEGLSMAHWWLRYDVSQVSVEDIKAGAMLSGDNGTSAFFAETNEAGLIEITFSRLAVDDEPLEVNGSGPIMSFKLSAKKEGVTQTRLSLVSVDMRDSRNASLAAQLPAEELVPFAKPQQFELSQNYPNPFNGRTEIIFRLPQAEQVKMTVLNILGQPVRTLVNERLEPGTYRRIWDGRNEQGLEVVSGIYLVHIETGLFHDIKRMAFVK